jgi:hypothetical protein
LNDKLWLNTCVLSPFFNTIKPYYERSNAYLNAIGDKEGPVRMAALSEALGKRANVNPTSAAPETRDDLEAMKNQLQSDLERLNSPFAAAIQSFLKFPSQR